MCTDFRTVEKKIIADGWILVRINGSHYQYAKAGVASLITVPHHSRRSISIGVIKSLEKTTGLSLR